MLVTSTVVLFFMLIFTGIGMLLWRQSRDGSPLPEYLTHAFWVGWTLSILFLQIWQLFFAVSLISLALLILAAAAGYILMRKPILARVQVLSKGGALTVTGFSGAFLLLLSNQATFAKYSYDHGLYHMQMVKWLTTFPLVPGLGNLHHRFAFNNSSLLYAAQINVGPLEGLAHQVASTLLVFMLVVRCLIALYRLLQQGTAARYFNLFYVLMIPFILHTILTSTFAGYSTDIVVFVLQVVLVGELLDLYSRKDRLLSETKKKAFFVILVSVIGITVKLSFVVFAVLASAAAVAAWWRKSAVDRPSRWSTISSWAGFSALLIVPWLIRHVVLSGYLLYPATLISFPVKWKIPSEMAEPIAGGITAWARELGGGTISPEDWFPNWFSVFPFEMKETVIYGVLLMAVVLGLRLFFRLKPVEWQGPVLMLGITVLSLIYWFWMAPSLRFSGALFWLVIVLSTVLLYDQLSQLKSIKSPHILLAFTLLLYMFWLSPDFKSVSMRTLIFPPFESSVAAEQIMGDPNQYQETLSGLKVFMAAGEAEELCWDMPLPCARQADFDPRLSLINPDDMRKGFFIRPSE